MRILPGIDGLATGGTANFEGQHTALQEFAAGNQRRDLRLRKPCLASGTLYDMHLPAERNHRDDKEQGQEPHAGLADELGYDTTRSTPQGLLHELRAPEEHLSSDD